MKRLKYLLLQTDNRSVNYTSMYEGPMLVIDTVNGKSCTYSESTSTYYSDSIGYRFSYSHKFALDKPTIDIQIPYDKLFNSPPLQKMRVYIADYCLREFNKIVRVFNYKYYNSSRPDYENGLFISFEPGPEVLLRNNSYFFNCPQKDYEYGEKETVYVNQTNIPQKLCICIKIQAQLPRKNNRKIIQMLCRDLPCIVNKFISEFNEQNLILALELAEKQQMIRKWLSKSAYCVFIANGSILPREKNSNQPMKGALPFSSPKDDLIVVHGISGMGIKKGITVITGGGYSGKTTLLDAISAGIYDHILGDGRELCITDSSAISISSEDGRSVKCVNVSPFFKWLPNQDVCTFSTEHASGSTSQAANIMEAVDAGAKLIIIDEDTSATNFMIRDEIMKKIVKKDPITPFSDRVTELFKIHGVSTILVIGGSSEYMTKADSIYLMSDYHIQNALTFVRELCITNQSTSFVEKADWSQKRKLLSNGFSSYPYESSKERLEVSDLGYIIIGDETIDVRGLKNLISIQQRVALGYMLRYLEITNHESVVDLKKRIDVLYDSIQTENLDFVFTALFNTTNRFFELPRKLELISLINRMRKITIKGR